MFCVDFRWLFTLFLFLPILAYAEDSSSKWEYGLAVTGLSFPNYRGSNQQQNYLAPLPYFLYEGKRLKIDRDGNARFYLYQGYHFWLDLSSSIAFPVNSSRDPARQGMPDLYTVIGIGPRAVFDLYHNSDDSLRIRAAFPLRMAIDIQHARSIGQVFSPFLQIRYSTSWETALSMGPIYANESYHDYYYQVDPQYATPTRPAYNARAGYSGFRFTSSSSHRFKNKRYLLGAFLRYDLLDSAVFVDSPLVKQKNSLIISVALLYRL